MILPANHPPSIKTGPQLLYSESNCLSAGRALMVVANIAMAFCILCKKYGSLSYNFNEMNAMASKRIFIALKVHPEAKLLERMQDFQKAFEKDKVKWVKPDAMHLTLKFLGETDENFIPELVEHLRPLEKTHLPFSMQLTGTGTFGKLHKPRVIWAGITGSEPAKLLQQEIETITTKLGFEAEDREFRPHLTLARVKFIRNTRLLQEMVQADQGVKFQELPVQAFYLYQSSLHPEGAKYQVLATFPLGRDARAE